jgi:hypothetical protein
MLRHEYPDIYPDDVPLLGRFENEVLPYLTRHGPWIGENALGGDACCEEIVRRTHLVVHGLAQFRRWNYRQLTANLKEYERRRHEGRSKA